MSQFMIPFFRILIIGCLASLTMTSGVYAQDKILRMPVISLPPTLGNPYGANGLPSALVWFSLYDPLVRTNEQGVLEAALALSWEAIEPTRWRFKLREGVTFSNGEPFDARAASFVLSWLMQDEARGLIVANEVQGISGIEVIDDFTLDVITREPDAILPKRLTAVQMLAPKALAEQGITEFARRPAGTGPFEVVSWNDGGKAVTRARHASWRPPMIDGIHFYQIPDETTLVQALQSGQVDLTTTLTPDAAFDMEGNGFYVSVSKTAQVLSFAFNLEGTSVEALHDPRVRLAMNLAVDRQAIADIVLHGTTTPANQPGTPLTFGYNPDLPPISYDPERARNLLTEAGYPNGFFVRADAVTAGNANASLIFQLVQQGLRGIGVDMELRSIVFSEWLRQYTTGTWEVDLFSLAFNSEPYYDVIRPMEYYSCAKPVPFFCHEVLMSSLNATGAEFNAEKRHSMLQGLSKTYREMAPAIYILEVSEVAVIADHVRNYRVRTRVPVYEALEIER